MIKKFYPVWFKYGAVLLTCVADKYFNNSFLGTYNYFL